MKTDSVLPSAKGHRRRTDPKKEHDDNDGNQSTAALVHLLDWTPNDENIPFIVDCR
ncbi:MAG TPA: hypothetical protein VGL74_00485 [Terriglobales bacterium]